MYMSNHIHQLLELKLLNSAKVRKKVFGLIQLGKGIVCFKKNFQNTNQKYNGSREKADLETHKLLKACFDHWHLVTKEQPSD